MTDLKASARRAERSDGAEAAARAGLVARGVVWTLIGLLALSVATGDDRTTADQGGALRALSDTPFGGVLLWVMAVAFLGLAGQRLLAAAVGHRRRSGSDRHLHRAASVLSAVFCLAAAYGCVRTVTGGGVDGEQQADSLTARVMAVTGGRTAVAVIGLVAVVVALVLAVRALKHDHADEVHPPQRVRRPVLWLGVAGHVGRSVAIGLVGGFLVHAALRFEPEQAKGLDASLAAVQQQPGGPALLLLAAAALLAYGLWSAAEAAWREV